jgi:hypothetical protein
MGKWDSGSAKWLKGEQLQDPEEVLVTWIRKANAKNRTEADKVIQEHQNTSEQQMSVTNSVHKNWFVTLCQILHYSKDEQDSCIRQYYYKVKVHTRQFYLSFKLKILTTVFRISYGTLIQNK